MRAIILTFFLALSAKGFAGDINCEDIGSLDAYPADNPVVKVAPKYPNYRTQRLIPGCAVLTFSLDRSELSSTPTSIHIEYATEKRFGKAAKEALKKWLYINKNVPESDRYYMVFHFELSDS